MVAALVTRKRSAFTVMTVWVTALKAVGKWAVKQREIAINPFAECSVSVPKKTRHRETKAFSTEEIRLILTSASAIKNTKRPATAARRWVPWICAYSGARAGEITQLRHQDVIERDGIKITNILLSRGFSTISKPKAPDRCSTTRPQLERLAPTSPTLSARRLFKCVAVLANGCAP